MPKARARLLPTMSMTRAPTIARTRSAAGERTEFTSVRTREGCAKPLVVQSSENAQARGEVIECTFLMEIDGLDLLVAERGQGGIQLPFAAIDQHHMRHYDEGFPLALIAPCYRLAHGCIIVARGNALNVVAAILSALHVVIVKHHTRGLRGLASRVRNVKTFHTQSGQQINFLSRRICCQFCSSSSSTQ